MERHRWEDSAPAQVATPAPPERASRRSGATCSPSAPQESESSMQVCSHDLSYSRTPRSKETRCREARITLTPCSAVYPSPGVSSGVGGGGSLGIPRLGRYQLLRKIAVGGMAELYLARMSGLGG